MNRNPFFANSVSGLFQTSIVSVLTFITIPVFIDKLGIEKYGIYSLLSVVGSTNIFASFGLNTTLKRFLSKQGKGRESNIDIVVAFVIVAIVSSVLSGVLLYFHKRILLDLLSMPHAYFAEGKKLFLFLVISNALLMIGQMFEAIIDSTEKIYISNYIRLGYNIMFWAFILIALQLDKSLFSVGIAILMATFIWFIVSFVYSVKIWGPFQLGGLWVSVFVSAKKQFFFTTKIYTAGLLTVIGQPLTKILISKYFGLDFVAYYEIVMRIRAYIFSLVNKSVYPLFPVLARMESKTVIKKMLTSLEQKLVILSIFFIALILALFPFLFGIWLPKIDAALIVLAIWILSLHLLLNATILPSLIYFSASNFPGSLIYFNAFFALGPILVYPTMNSLGPIFVIVFAEFVALTLSYFIAGFFQYKQLQIKKIDVFAKPAMKASFSISVFGVFIIFTERHYFYNCMVSKIIVVLLLTAFCFYALKVFHVVSISELNWLFPANNTIKKFFGKLFINKF